MKNFLFVPVLVLFGALSVVGQASGLSSDADTGHTTTVTDARPTATTGDAGRTLSPYFFVKSDDAAIDRLPLKSTAAAVDIVGVIARVKVTQVYRNEGRHALEAIYVFPGSTRAAVHAMKMTIGERVITARIEERQEARRQYEQARQSGRTASLLEQQRPNVFQMNVANILPGDEVKVDLTYSELLLPEKGVYEFVYPTVVGPRYSTTDAASAPQSEGWVENPYLHQGEATTTTFDFQARVSAGMPVKQVASPSHDVKVSFSTPSRATVTLSPAETNAGNRDVVLRYRLSDDRIESGVVLYEDGGENFFLCMVEPPQRFAPAAVPPRDYVFVMDVSGSMNGFPIDTSKELLRNVLGRLRPIDSFNVLFFSGGTWVLSTTPVEASEMNKAWALREIERQHGGGGTELLPALRQAFDLPRARPDIARSIVIATDGYVNVEREAFGLIRNRLGDASVFTFGIGSSVNRHLIEGMARVGEGLPFVVLDGAEARRAAGRFLQYIESPLLTRVEVQTPGFSVYDLEPGRVPDLYAQRPLVIAGKYRGEPAGEIVVRGFTGQGRFERRIAVDRGRVSASNEVLKYLWARERLSLLSDFAVADGGDVNVTRRQEITALGLKYGLLTEFTSFVAIDQRVRRQDGRLETVKQPLPLPQGVSDLAVGGGAPSYRGVVAETVAVAGAAPMLDARAKQQAPLARPSAPPDRPSRPDAAALHVKLVENRLTGPGVVPGTLRQAIERALAGGTCRAVAAGRPVRLKVVFNAQGRVDRVEGAARDVADCLLRALQASLQLPGVTGGYVVVSL